MNAIFFWKTSFLTSWQFCENTIVEPIDNIGDFEHTQKFKRERKDNLGPVFNTTLGPVFNTKKNQVLGQF